MENKDKAVYSSPITGTMDLNTESPLCVSTGDPNQNYGYGNTNGWF